VVTISIAQIGPSIKRRLDTRSVRGRFLWTLSFNSVRTVTSLLTGIVLARALGASDFGNFVFLVGTFTAVKGLLDMGTSSAFFTFISQRERQGMFHFAYVGWLCTQFVMAVMFIGMLLPRAWLHFLWVGHQRPIILLAFVAMFLQELAWGAVTQLGEASRATGRVQGLNCFRSVMHLSLTFFCWRAFGLSLALVFGLIIAEFMLLITLAAVILRRQVTIGHSSSEFSFCEMLGKYWNYCLPLSFYTILGFVHKWIDTWLLQQFGGSREQGYYGIGQRCGAVTLLATSSILRIFWKEIAEAAHGGEKGRVKQLYWRVSKGLYFFGAGLSGFLIPWAKELLVQFVGIDFKEASLPFALMLIYPIQQCLGQINGTMYYATELTHLYTWLGGVGMIVSIIVTYLLLAPRNFLIPGLALGAKGMALKMVVVQMCMVNIMGYFLSRRLEWKYEWSYQVTWLLFFLSLGYASRYLAYIFIDPASFITGIILSGLAYALLVGVGVLLWRFSDMLVNHYGIYLPFKVRR